jgi:hypothetical protein
MKKTLHLWSGRIWLSGETVQNIFFSLTSFCLLIAGVEGYCCIWSHSMTITHILDRIPLDEGSGCSRGLYPYNAQHLQETNIHAPGGIRTRNPSKRATADLSLRVWLHWSQKRHNTTVWTDPRQGSKNQTHYCLCQRLHWNRSDWNVISPDCLAPTQGVCFEPTVWPDACCSAHRIRVLLQWTKRV